MIANTHEFHALTLWTLGTYCFNDFYLFPRLLIHSPEKRCGKTTLIHILDGLVDKSLVSSNISSAAIYRFIETKHPTLLIDEADTFLNQNEHLRGIINSGHTKRTAYVSRVVGQNSDLNPKRFSTWAPMAIAMIQNPPDTILDRSVVIALERKLTDQKTQKLPVDFFEQQRDLRRKLKRWAKDNQTKLKQTHPQLPSLDNDRALDNWMPLVTIAQALSSQWYQYAIQAMQIMGQETKDESIGIMLLADIQKIFLSKSVSRIHSDDLVIALNGLEDRPWGEIQRGHPLTKHRLAKLLKPFKLYPKQVRIGFTNKNGYTQSGFQMVFQRYLTLNTPVLTSETLQSSHSRDLSDFQNSTKPQSVEFLNGSQASDTNGCRVVEQKKAYIDNTREEIRI